MSTNPCHEIIKFVKFLAQTCSLILRGISNICYSLIMHKNTPRVISLGISLVGLTLGFAFIQASSLDFVRNHRELVYILGLVLRVLSFLAGIAILFIFLSRRDRQTNRVKRGVLLLLLVFLGIQSGFFYATLVQDSTNPHCLNEVQLYGVTGDMCWLPD